MRIAGANGLADEVHGGHVQPPSFSLQSQSFKS